MKVDTSTGRINESHNRKTHNFVTTSSTSLTSVLTSIQVSSSVPNKRLCEGAQVAGARVVEGYSIVTHEAQGICTWTHHQEYIVRSSWQDMHRWIEMRGKLTMCWRHGCLEVLGRLQPQSWISSMTLDAPLEFCALLEWSIYQRCSLCKKSFPSPWSNRSLQAALMRLKKYIEVCVLTFVPWGARENLTTTPSTRSIPAHSHGIPRTMRPLMSRTGLLIP